jgi:branched-chain amino acid transport system substrate-binding protein
MLLLTLTPLSLAADKILFAICGPMTGDSAAIGIQEKNGAIIAVDEINAAGGISGKKLEFIVGDDMANPNQATILAQKLASNKDILFVLGHVNSGCSLSALPIYEKVGLPVISPTNTNPTITEMGYKNYFRIIASDDLIVKQQVLLGVKELGIKKPAIIWENTDYGKGMRDVALKNLKQMGIAMVGDESYVPGVDRDYSAQVTKFKGAGADGVFFMGEYTAAALFLKQAKTLGLNAQVVGGSGASNPKLLEIAGPAAEGFYALTCFDPNDKRPVQAEFIQKYTTRFRDKPGEWSSHAYDVVYLVKKVYEMGGTTREKLIQYLHKVKAFPGITGVIEFDEKGDVPGKKVMVLVVKKGDFQTYIPTKY